MCSKNGTSSCSASENLANRFKKLYSTSMTQMILHKIDLKLFDVWLKGTFYTCYTTVSKAYKTYMYIYRTVGATSKKLRNGNVMNWARFPRQLLVCMKELYTPLIMVCLGIIELLKKNPELVYTRLHTTAFITYSTLNRQVCSFLLCCG